jgi:taurine dioxygenase
VELSSFPTSNTAHVKTMTALTVTLEDKPIGAAISGIDLTDNIPDAVFGEIKRLIAERSVVVVRNQKNLPSSVLVTFARHFGTPQVNVRAEANNKTNPEIFWVSNVNENGKPLGSHDAGRYWHSDLCYLEKPSDLTLLHALEVPSKGGVSYGATQFASASAAYDALPTDIKNQIDRRTARNGYRFMWNRKAHEFGKRPVLSAAELTEFPDDAVHPIVRTHPRTGRKCLFICDGYTHQIDGLPEDESDTLLAHLFGHLVHEEFRYSHEWQVGDLLIWDNCAVQHKARFDYPPQLRRRMQRCTTEGSAPY